MNFVVRVELCPNCDSPNTENLVRVQTGSPIRVYVRCRECGTFVGRYTLERYTSDKTYESLLRFMRKHGHSIASRSRAQELEGFSKTVQEEFCETSDAPKSNLRLEEIIWEHEHQR